MNEVIGSSQQSCTHKLTNRNLNMLREVRWDTEPAEERITNCIVYLVQMYVYMQFE